MTFQASESRNGGTNVKGGLTTLLMRGLHHYEEFIDAGAAHHLCDDTAGRESHHITESESGAHESEQFRPGIPIETMKTGGG